ncbi:MAG: TetR/AcrR family transcriptional regulator [Thermomicrobiales bacterium]
MSSYEAIGRTNQKLRTRRALIDKATELVRLGRSPTVAEVAEAALISKSAAYRYFPSQELLLVEVALDEVVREDLTALYAASEQPGSPQERLDAVIRGDLTMQIKHEDAIRRAVAAWIVRDAPSSATRIRRPGNRLRYVALALDEVAVQLGEERFEQLLQAIAMCMGIESVIVLMDICGLSESEAESVKRWAVQALLDASLRDVPGSST